MKREIDELMMVIIIRSSTEREDGSEREKLFRRRRKNLWKWTLDGNESSLAHSDSSRLKYSRSAVVDVLSFFFSSEFSTFFLCHRSHILTVYAQPLETHFSPFAIQFSHSLLADDDKKSLKENKKWSRAELSIASSLTYAPEAHILREYIWEESSQRFSTW